MYNVSNLVVRKVRETMSVAIVMIIGDFPCFDLFSDSGHQPF